MTVKDIIKRALRLIGAIDLYNEPPGEVTNACLLALNQMLGQWSAQRWLQGIITLSSYTAAQGTASVTIGPAKNIAVQKPTRVLSAYVRIYGVDYPLVEWSREEYNTEINKTLQGLPEWYHVEDFGTYLAIVPYPVPNESTEFFVDLQTPFSPYASADDDLGLSNEYQAAVTYNLAVDISPEFPALPLSQVVIGKAREAIILIKNINSEPVPFIDTDPLNGKRSYNIMEDC